jgi:hypothetical protein
LYYWISEDFCCIQISGQTAETIEVKFDIQILELISEAVSNFGIDTQIGTRDISQISNGSEKKFLEKFRNGKEKPQYRQDRKKISC